MRFLLTLFFILLALLPSVVVSYGADEAFVYRRAGRDPFWPWVTPDGKFIQGEGGADSLEDVVLEGIIWDSQGESMAMMNGRVLRQGERIGRFEIFAIHKEEVTLKGGEKYYTLRLKLPELGERSP